jgi:hypothetical protein
MGAPRWNITIVSENMICGVGRISFRKIPPPTMDENKIEANPSTNTTTWVHGRMGCSDPYPMVDSVCADR